MSDLGGTGEGFSPGNVGGWIAKGISEGLSQRETLRQLRDAGLSTGDAAFRRAWGEISDTYARRAGWMAADPTAVPSIDAYGTWAAGKAGSYMTRVDLVLRTKGTNDVILEPFLYGSQDPVAPQEAIDFAIATKQAAIDNPEFGYAQVLIGAVPTNGWQMTGRAA